MKPLAALLAYTFMRCSIWAISAAPCRTNHKQAWPRPSLLLFCSTSCYSQLCDLVNLYAHMHCL